ncbi:MAG: hypothetical protein OK449_06765 [Thaumarchaeota archaeon]|nr:hypothetical protein [Nitrososphaerota archaeon]
MFVVDHKHTAETCPGGKIHHDDDFFKKVDEARAKSGLKIIEGYLDAPGHRFYFVVEAESVNQLFEFAATTLSPIGETNVVPVLKWSEAWTEGQKLGIQK